jgi:hypothetical protein
MTSVPTGALPKVIPPGRSPRVIKTASDTPNSVTAIACSPLRSPYDIWSLVRKAIGMAIAARS